MYNYVVNVKTELFSVFWYKRKFNLRMIQVPKVFSVALKMRHIFIVTHIMHIVRGEKCAYDFRYRYTVLNLILKMSKSDFI